MIKIAKDPNASKAYGFDFAADLNGVTLESAEWFVAGPDEELTLGSPVTDDTTSKVLLSGGTLGAIYTVTCRTVRSDDEIDDHSLRVEILER